jgi:dTMP kinase
MEHWIAGYFALVLLHHADAVVKPALRAGRWVVADRWALDHCANQQAFGVDMRPWLPLLNAVPRPDVHILLDLPVGTAERHIASRGRDPGVGSGATFLSRAAALMRACAEHPNGAGIVVMDATMPPQALLAHAVTALDRLDAPLLRRPG